MTVWILQILDSDSLPDPAEGMHGITAHATERAAKDELFGFVNVDWDYDSWGQMPDSDDEAVAAYFGKHMEGRRRFLLEEMPVNGQ